MTYDILLVWACIYLYAGASFLILTGFVFTKQKLLDAAGYAVTLAFLAHTAVFAGRWLRTGYFPANGNLENAITGGLFAIAVTVYLFFRNRRQWGVALFTVPAALLLLGFGIMSEPNPLPLAASFKSSWLLVHVAFAQLSFGAYVVTSAFALLYLLKAKYAGRPFYDRFPRLEILEETMFKFVVYGFIADSIMIVAGAIWAKSLWGSYWAWDPVEVWSLTSWLLYGLSIHLKVTLGWRGRKLAWLMLSLLTTVIIAYWGIDAVVINTRHMFGVKG